MRILVLLMVMILTAGCSLFQTQKFVDPLTNSLGWTEGAPEVSCPDAIRNAYRVLKEQMPDHYGVNEVQLELERDHQLIAIWRNSTGRSDAYDIKSMPITLRERLEREKANREIRSFRLINGDTCAIVEVAE